MTLHLSDDVASEVLQHGVVGGCTWSWGVYCQVDVDWKTRPTAGWGAQCLKGQELLKEVTLTAVIVPMDKNGKGPVQVDGVQNCWSAGGDGLRLVLHLPEEK